MDSINEQTSEANTPTWEKVLGGCGLLLLLAGFAYLGWTAIVETESPPDVIFNPVKISEIDNGYLVEVEVTNTGSQNMAALNLDGRLIKDDSEEIRRAQLDYLPSRSKNYVGFFFTTDPRTGTLQFQPSGYQEP